MIENLINIVVTGLLVNSLWVYGILKENPKLMLPHIILTFFAIIMMFLSPLFLIIYYHSEKTDDKDVNNRLAYVCTAGSLILYCIGGKYVLTILFFFIIIINFKSFPHFFFFKLTKILFNSSLNLSLDRALYTLQNDKSWNDASTECARTCQ